MAEMNTASENFVHHLGVLREKLEHKTDYEKALHYFLEEFAADIKFHQESMPEDAPHVLAVLEHVVVKALGQPGHLEQARVLHLPGFKFFHGNAAVAGRVVLFFYFEEADTGLLAMIPGLRGDTEVARFRLTGGLVNPQRN